MIELIAELSGCHGGSLGNALRLISAAKEAGATGIKLQAFDPARLAKRRAGHHRIDNQIHDDLLALYTATYTPQEWFPNMISRAVVNGLTWHASVFDPEDVAFLETLDCPRYKIASFEALDREILNAVRATGKPAIISINQSDDFREWIPNATFLHATDYGVPASKAHLHRIRDFARDDHWGLSDHTTESIASIAAVVLGASMIEWHIKLPGVSTPDDAFAWEPDVFRYRVDTVRAIEEAMNG